MCLSIGDGVESGNATVVQTPGQVKVLAISGHQIFQNDQLFDEPAEKAAGEYQYLLQD